MIAALGEYRWFIIVVNIIEALAIFALSFAVVTVYFRLRKNTEMLHDICDDMDELMRKLKDLRP